MVVQIGIAMYRIIDDNGRDPYFHWALCLGESLATDQMITVYQFVRDDAIERGVDQSQAWKNHFTFVNLCESSTFVGVVIVGTIIDPDCTMNAIDSFIRENCPPVNHTGFTIVGPAVPKPASSISCEGLLKFLYPLSGARFLLLGQGGWFLAELKEKL